MRFNLLVFSVEVNLYGSVEEYVNRTIKRLEDYVDKTVEASVKKKMKLSEDIKEWQELIQDTVKTLEGKINKLDTDIASCYDVKKKYFPFTLKNEKDTVDERSDDLDK
jgi:SMC interacting uncharacterized protein involved in chromosome segregation